MTNMSKEMGKLEEDYKEVQDQTEEYLEARKDDSSSIASTWKHRQQEDQAIARKHVQRLEKEFQKEEERYSQILRKA